jgi:DNA recombination protein RmuC
LNDQLSQSQKAMNERLDAVSKRVGDGLNDQTERTGQTLKAPAERLAIIDTAQKNLIDLSQQVVGLLDILSNKQVRGSFGEIQLENLVSDALPKMRMRFNLPYRMVSGWIA